MSNDPNAFLLGGGGKSAKFENVGDSTIGTVAQTPEVRQQTKLEDGTPLTWDNGDPKMQLVVTLQTDNREDGDDDGLRKLYVKGSKDPASKSLHAAVAGAVQASGAKGLEVGGKLQVTYIGDGVSKTRGFNPPKQYQAVYTPAAAGFLADAAPASGIAVNTAIDTADAPPAGVDAAVWAVLNPTQRAALRNMSV